MRIFVKKLWSNEFYKGGLFLTIASFIGNILNYFFNILVGRTLGPPGFGEISTLFSYIALTSIPLTILSTIIIQKISSAEENSFAITRSIEDYFLVKIKRWFFLIIFLVIFIPFIPQVTNLTLVTSYSLIPFILLSFLTSFYGAALQGLRLFFLLAIIGLGSSLFKLLGAILVYAGIDGLTTIISFIFISVLINLLASIYIIHRNVYRKMPDKFFPKINKRILHVIREKQFIITTFSIIGITLFSTIDIVFVKKFFTAEQAGIYSSWSLFAKLILYVLGPINSLALVFFSGKKNLTQQDRVLSITLLVLVFISFVSFVFYTTFAPFVVNLFFGSKFYAVIPILGTASIFGFFFTVISFVNSYFLAKNSYLSLTLAFAMPLYIVFLFILPRELNAVIQLNIIFFGIVTLLYLFGYFRSKSRSTL
ncbi:MAG: oligosaccharide flippase family protein [Candidatus Roizmanbacteria bacterium]|nr:MAG: oligosaccharide flippase family protein [Candidatus Roizmanbacteria bacterium]